MENKCSKCGGKMVTGRFTTGAFLVGFTPLEDEKKLKPRHLKVFCDACVECGSIENIRAEKPETLK
jgi:hypothetical protein